MALSSPACDASLRRTEKNFVLLTFDRVIMAPSAGEIMILEMMVGGATGADPSANFTYSGCGNRLRITENVASLVHRSWYPCANVGVRAGVADFERDYVVKVGDCDNNGFVVGADFSCVNARIPCFNCPDERGDIDGDNIIVGADSSLVNSKIASFPVAKPTGHACSP